MRRSSVKRVVARARRNGVRAMEPDARAVVETLQTMQLGFMALMNTKSGREVIRSTARVIIASCDHRDAVEATE